MYLFSEVFYFCEWQSMRVLLEFAGHSARGSIVSNVVHHHYGGIE
jgi:hypothetical protein